MMGAREASTPAGETKKSKTVKVASDRGARFPDF